MTDKRVDEINAYTTADGHVNGRCVLVPVSDDPITRWAQRYAVEILDTLEYTTVLYTAIKTLEERDVRLSTIDTDLRGFDDFREIDARLKCPLEGAEYRAMLAAIPNEMDTLQYIQDSVPAGFEYIVRKPTTYERLAHRLDYLGYLVLSKVVIPPFTWALGKVKAYNERKENK